jgi:putative DNA primase/helicase
LKSWFVFDGEFWRRDTDGRVSRFAHDCVEQMLQEAAARVDSEARTAQIKFALKSQQRASIENMVALARDLVPLPVHKLDEDKLLLGVLNGVIDLRTGKFRKARREDYITKRANVAFDANATCPNWLAFQEKISGGDQELIRFKQRMFGSTLSGVFLESIFILHGGGANGKTSEASTISDILGDYSCTADSQLMMAPHNKGGATPEILALKGKRGCFINETAEGDVLNEQRVKYVTSNEPITARGLFQDLVTFQPTHKTILSTNHKPYVRGSDLGIWRRIHYVPYEVTIPTDERDIKFKEKMLVPEAAGILNWLLIGWQELQRNNLRLMPPAVISDAANEYRGEQNTVRQFVENCCKTDASYETTSLSILFTAYQIYCSDEYGFKGRGRRQFQAELKSLGFEKTRISGNLAGYIGIKLVAPLNTSKPDPF